MGERAGAALPKQFATIGGRPLLAWSFDVLREGGCDPIVVVAPEEHLDRARDVLSLWEGVMFTSGGRTRQLSVRAGLEKVSSEIVVIHDAARPFASPSAVQRVCEAVRDADGAVLAIPVDDTIKQVEEGRIVSTVDRSPLWRSQTPQAFRVEVLKAAHEAALRDRFASTDDAELVERIGGKVMVIEGSPRNIKITQSADLELAEVLAARGTR